MAAMNREANASRDHPPPASLQTRHGWWVMALLGGAILLCVVAIARVSPQLQYETPSGERPLLAFIGLYMVAGLLWLAAILLLPRLRSTPAMLLAIIAIGLLMRLVTIGSAPILEDDYHRYLWDGSVTASGDNPYATSPAEAQPTTATSDEATATLARINHPQFTTIYPPVAQAAFAAAHAIQPFSIEAWRAVVLLAECASLAVLLLGLRRLGLPLMAAAIYWWCPLIVIEFAQRLHMDALLIPLLLLAMGLAVAGRAHLVGLALGLAAGVKVWPVVLAPVLLRRQGVSRAVFVGGCAIAICIGIAMIAPLLLSRGGAESAGLVAYASHWHNNSALYLTLGWLLQPIAWITPLAAEHAHYLARPLLAVGFLLILALLSRTPAAKPTDIVLRCTAVIAALFLLSPAQFPWYLAWVIAPAALAFPLASPPQRTLLAAMLLYVVTLPLYYLTYAHAAWVFAVHLPPTVAMILSYRWMHTRPNRRPHVRSAV